MNATADARSAGILPALRAAGESTLFALFALIAGKDARAPGDRQLQNAVVVGTWFCEKGAGGRS